jgi:hypothetical protein
MTQLTSGKLNVFSYKIIATLGVHGSFGGLLCVRNYMRLSQIKQ